MDDAVIVGIGNPFRGDDGVGSAVIDCVRPMVEHRLSVQKSDGSIFSLMDIFSSHQSVFIVDAMVSKEPLGSLQKIDALRSPIPKDFAATSSHGLGLAQAIDLSRALGQAPKRIILFLISGANFAIQDTLSISIVDLLPTISNTIAQDVLSCMSEPYSTTS